jgi:uncharacterized membrane protein
MPDPAAPPENPRTERRGSTRTIEDALERVDPFLLPQLFVAAAIALDLFLPERLTIGPSWLLPSVEGALLAALTLVAPHPRARDSRLRRRVAIALIAIVSGTNIYSLVELVRYLLHHHVGSARDLIFAGVQLWLTNVLLFSLWYWELDQGGPTNRSARTRTEEPLDFMFPQDAEPDLKPAGWSPGLIDYLYVSFTNATAFSPTDTMPLSQSAKLLMTVQALTSLLIVVLVVSRAVNILA